MGEPGQDRAFALEAPRGVAADGRQVQQLDRHLAFEAAVGAARAPDAAHAAVAQRRLEQVRADRLADEARAVERHEQWRLRGVAAQELRTAGGGFIGEQRVKALGDRRLLGAQLGQARRARGIVELEQLVEQRAHALPLGKVGQGHRRTLCGTPVESETGCGTRHRRKKFFAGRRYFEVASLSRVKV